MPKLTLTRCVRAIPWLVLTLIFGWTAWERFRLPLTPCADPDVWVYLIPGLSKLHGGPFLHVYGQCFLYPWFLFVVLWGGGDFRWVALIQHGLGLGTGALLYGCWRQLRAFVPAPRVPALLFELLGAALVGVYLFSTSAIEFEHALRPESIFPFFVLLQMYCNLAFIRARFFGGSPRRARLSGGGAVFCSVVAWLLKPSFAATLIPANLPVLISLGCAGASARDKWRLGVVPALAVAILLLWPEWRLRQGDDAGPLFLARSLFSVHANFINDEMGEVLTQHAATPYTTEFIGGAHTALSQSLSESRGAPGEHWPALGFNPDYLVYGSQEKTSFAKWVSDRTATTAAEIEFYRYWYGRTLRRHPGWFAAKVWRQIDVFYSPKGCPAYRMATPYDLRAEYALSVECLSTEVSMRNYPLAVALREAAEPLKTRAGKIEAPAWMTRVNRWLAVSYLPACLWVILLGLGVWWVPQLRGVYGMAPLVLVLLFAYNFGTVLTLAFSHSLDVGRYSVYQLAYTLLPQFGSVALAAEPLAAAVTGTAAGLAAWHGRVWPRLGARERRWVGVVVVAGLVLGIVLGWSAWRRAHKKKHRHRKVPAVVSVVGGAAS